MTYNKPSLVIIPAKTGEKELDYGITVGRLVLTLGGDCNLLFKDEQGQIHARPAIHPQFSPEEAEYLLETAFVMIKNRVESLHRLLDDGKILEDAHRDALMDEVRRIKEFLMYCWPDEPCDELKRVNDLADVLISRLIELSKIQVVGVVKIED